jgi:Uma2 family endonuclease
MQQEMAQAGIDTSRATEAQLRAMPRDGRKYELVDGRIAVSPAGTRHGVIAVRLGARLLEHVEAHDLGYVLDSSTGFRMPGGNVRSPDVSFVRKGRYPDEHLPVGFSDVVPDLAVEILSPEDRPRAVLDKVGEYLEAGVSLVWVIDPEARSAAVHRSLAAVDEVGPEGALVGAEVVPGFRCPLAGLLP